MCLDLMPIAVWQTLVSKPFCYLADTLAHLGGAPRFVVLALLCIACKLFKLDQIWACLWCQQPPSFEVPEMEALVYRSFAT